MLTDYLTQSPKLWPLQGLQYFTFHFLSVSELLCICALLGMDNSHYKKGTATNADIMPGVTVLSPAVNRLGVLLCRSQGLTFSSDSNVHHKEVINEATFHLRESLKKD